MTGKQGKGVGKVFLRHGVYLGKSLAGRMGEIVLEVREELVGGLC